jgi:hypothetical protein
LNAKELMRELGRSCEENMLVFEGLFRNLSRCVAKYFFPSFKKESKNDARD